MIIRVLFKELLGTLRMSLLLHSAVIGKLPIISFYYLLIIFDVYNILS